MRPSGDVLFDQKIIALIFLVAVVLVLFLGRRSDFSGLSVVISSKALITLKR